MPRLRVSLDDSDRERAKEYAQDEGVMLCRAYAELIEEGLDGKEY